MALTINLGFVAGASGADTITATWSPAPLSYTDKMLLFFRAAASNSTTTPTINVNGLGAKSIVKKGGNTLVVGDIPAQFAICGICYDLVNDRFELINPATENITLEQVLINGNNTNGKNIVINDGDEIRSNDNIAKLAIRNNGVLELTTDNFSYLSPYLYLDASTNSAYFSDQNFNYILGDGANPSGNYTWGNSNDIRIVHGTKVIIDSPITELVQATPERILATDVNNFVQSLDTATYPDLTELSYLKGVTSSIQAQIDNKAGYTLQGASGSSNPADTTTYYLGSSFSAGVTTSGNAVRRLYIPKSGTIKWCNFIAHVTGSTSSAQTTTVSIRLNNTTDTLISSALTTTASFNQVTNTGLSIAVVQGDFIEFKVETPTWTSNPTNVFYTATIYID